jgi:hypothetical protein
MPPTAPQHPSDADLAAFALGKLAPAAAGAVEHHLADCPACRTVVEYTPGDPLVGLLRQANPADRSASRALTPSLQGSVTKGSLPPPAPALNPEDLPPALRDHPRYRIIRLLGQGGMGVVYQAEHKLMERLVAVKVISRALVDQPEAAERFNREVRAAARLDHPHIVKAYDAERAGDLQLLAMEYVEGKSLADVLQKKGPLPVAHACHYARQAALGLQHAHERGMVHRDLKPQNLMLTPRGIVKILDFGLAKLASERTRQKGLTHENTIMGTPDYLAPEQAQNTKAADIRADIYSLGCTLFCLLAGRPPFAGENAMPIILAHMQDAPPALESLRPDVPPGLAALVARMLAKDPAERPQTPQEVAEALAPFAKAAKAPESEAVTVPLAPPVPPADGGAPFAGLTAPLAVSTQRTPRTADRRRWMIPVIAGAAALVLSFGLWVSGALRVKTPVGTLALTVNESGAEILVDGAVARVSRAGNEPVEVEAVAGKHWLEVRKGGFKTWAQEVSVSEGRRLELATRLEQEPAGERPAKKPDGGPPPTAVQPARNRSAVITGENWRIDDQDLVQESPRGNASIWFGDGAWADYAFEFKFKVERADKPYCCAVVRSPTQNLMSYHCTFGLEDNTLFGVTMPRKDLSGKTHRQLIGWRNHRIEAGQWYPVRIETRGDSIRCRIGNEEVTVLGGPDYRHGAVALHMSNTAARFRDIKVTDPAGNILWEGLPSLPNKPEADNTSIGTQHTVHTPDGLGKLPPAAPARGEKSQAAPLAWFRFGGNDKNEGKGEATFELINTEFQQNALYLNGIYESSGAPGGYRAVCRTPALNYETFTVAVRFKAEDFTPNKCNLLTGGTAYRWFGVERSPAGNLLVMFNNGDYKREIKGAPLEIGKWTVIACSVDVPRRRVVTCFNGRRVAEIDLPKDFELQVVKGQSGKEDYDKVWSFTNYSNGKVFHGIVDELLIYDRALSEDELDRLPLRP